MLQSGLTGAIFAVLAAALGLAQALLKPRSRAGMPLNEQSLWARCFDLSIVYFGVHFIVAVVLFCLWMTPSPLVHQHLLLQLLLESAWIEGMAIVLFQCLIIIYHDRTLRDMFSSVAAVTGTLHIIGFVLLIFNKDSGKGIQFGASLLVPTSLLVAMIQIRRNLRTSRKGRKIFVLGLYSTLNICGLIVYLIFIKDSKTFLQINVISITTTDLILLFMPLSRISRDIGLFCPRSKNLVRDFRGQHNRASRLSEACSNSTFSIARKFSSQTPDAVSVRSNQCASDSVRPPTPLMPPAPVHQQRHDHRLR